MNPIPQITKFVMHHVKRPVNGVVLCKQRQMLRSQYSTILRKKKDMFEFEALGLILNLRVLYHVQSSIIFDEHPPPARKIKDMCPQILREKCLGCQQIFHGKAGPSVSM